MTFKNKYYLAGTFLILITSLLTLSLVKQIQNSQSSAASADKLEAEGGTLSGAATSQSDSNASGGNYVALGINPTNTPTPISNANSCIFPPDSTTSYTPISRPDLPRPEYLAKTIDPTFNNEIYRIADDAVFGVTGNIVHYYSKNQPWNSNQTLIKLTGKYILDGKTYALKGKLPGGGLLWSHSDPNLLYGYTGTKLETISATTGTHTTIYDFTNYASITIGADEGNLSYDDKSVVIMGTKSNGEIWIIVFDISTKTIVAEKSALSLGGFNQPDWASISPSGKFVVINWRQRPVSTNIGNVISYDRNLNKVADFGVLGEHGDIGYDTSGNEIYAQMQIMTYFRLDNGQAKKYLPYNLSGHISMQNYKRPGWAYISTYGANKEEGFAIKMDGSGITQRFAHLHTNGLLGYDKEPHLVPSPDGSKVLWKSDWTEGSERITYPYIASKTNGYYMCNP